MYGVVKGSRLVSMVQVANLVVRYCTYIKMGATKSFQLMVIQN